MLKQCLHIQPRREVVGGVEAGQVGDGTAAGEVDVVAAVAQRQVECLAVSGVDRRPDGDDVAPKAARGGGPDTGTEGGRAIRVVRVRQLVEIIAARRHGQAGHGERIEHALAADVIGDAPRRAVLPQAVVMQVEHTGLHVAAEVPEAREADVGRQFLILEEAVRPCRVVNREVELAETAGASQKADLGIEVFAVLLVAGNQPPSLRVVAAREAPGVLTFGGVRRVGATEEPLNQAVLSEA